MHDIVVSCLPPALAFTACHLLPIMCCWHCCALYNLARRSQLLHVVDAAGVVDVAFVAYVVD